MGCRLCVSRGLYLIGIVVMLPWVCFLLLRLWFWFLSFGFCVLFRFCLLLIFSFGNGFLCVLRCRLVGFNNIGFMYFGLLLMFVD